VGGFGGQRGSRCQVLTAGIEAEHFADCRVSGYPARECEGERHEVVMRDHVVHQTKAKRLAGVDELTGDRHLPGLAHADSARQQCGEAPRRNHAQYRVGVRETRPLRGDDERATQRYLQGSGDACAVDRADDRLAHRAQRTGRTDVQRTACLTRTALQPLEVDTGREHRINGGKHDGAHIVIAVGCRRGRA
jgi:hypothetical protein